VTDKQLDAGNLDLTVLRELTALGSYAPSREFSDRVMARVRLPQPAALVLFRRAGAWVMQPRRAVTLATAYAASVIIALRLAVPWLQAHAGALRLGVAWIGAQVASSFDAATMGLADWAVQSGVAGAIRSATSSGVVVPALAAVAVGYAAAGLCFYALLKSPGRTDALARS
jgi:hypothetical protein